MFLFQTAYKEKKVTYEPTPEMIKKVEESKRTKDNGDVYYEHHAGWKGGMLYDRESGTWEKISDKTEVIIKRDQGAFGNQTYITVNGKTYNTDEKIIVSNEDYQSLVSSGGKVIYTPNNETDKKDPSWRAQFDPTWKGELGDRMLAFNKGFKYINGREPEINEFPEDLQKDMKIDQDMYNNNLTYDQRVKEEKKQEEKKEEKKDKSTRKPSYSLQSKDKSIQANYFNDDKDDKEFYEKKEKTTKDWDNQLIKGIEKMIKTYQNMIKVLKANKKDATDAQKKAIDKEIEKLQTLITKLNKEIASLGGGTKKSGKTKSHTGKTHTNSEYFESGTKISKTDKGYYNPSKMLDQVEKMEDKESLLKKYYDNYNNRECLVKLIYNMDGRSMAGDLSIKGVKITNDKVEEILKDADALMRKLYLDFNPESMSADQKTVFMIITHQLASGYTQDEVAERIKAINGKTPKEAADLLISMETELGAKSGVFGYIRETAVIYSQDYSGTEVSPNSKTTDASKVSMMATIQEDTLGLLPFYDNLLKLGLWPKVEDYFGKDESELTPEQKARREEVMVNGVFDKTLLTMKMGQVTDYYNTIDLLKTDPRVTDIMALYKNATGKELTDDDLRAFADNIPEITPPLFSVGKLLENFKEAQKTVSATTVDYSKDKDMKVLYEISKLEVNAKGKIVSGSIYDILYMAGYVEKDKNGSILLTEKAEKYFEGSIFTHTQDLKDAVEKNQLTPETAFFLNMITTGQISSKVITNNGGKSLGDWGYSKWALRDGAKSKMEEAQVKAVNGYLKLFSDSDSDDGQLALAKSLFSGSRGERPIDILFSTNAAVLGKTSAQTTTNPVLVTILSDPELSKAFYFKEDGSMRAPNERTELQVRIENGKKYDKESISAVIKAYNKEILANKDANKVENNPEVKKETEANVLETEYNNTEKGIQTALEALKEAGKITGEIPADAAATIKTFFADEKKIKGDAILKAFNTYLEVKDKQSEETIEVNGSNTDNKETKVITEIETNSVFSTGTAWFDAIGKEKDIQAAFDKLSEEGKKAFLKRAKQNIDDGTYSDSPDMKNTILRHIGLVSEGESS